VNVGCSYYLIVSNFGLNKDTTRTLDQDDTPIHFQQGKRTAIGYGGLFSLTSQGFEILSIERTELDMLFFHPAIFIQQAGFVIFF